MQPRDLFRHLCAMKLQTHFLLLSQGHLCRIRAHQLQQKGNSTRRHPRPLPEHLAVHELDATAPCTVPIPNHLPLVQLVTNTATLRATSGLSSRRRKGKMGVFFASTRHLVFTCRLQADALAFRQQHTMGTRKKNAKFSIKTGTGVLHRHLFEHHANKWIEGCDKLRIPITAKEAQRALTDYRHRKGQVNANANSTEHSKPGRPFSQEAFVDAIVEFIVADDQVCTVSVRNHQFTQMNLLLVHQCH